MLKRQKRRGLCLRSKQNQCWSFFQVTFTTRMSEEFKLLLLRKTQRSTTPSIVPNAALLLSTSRFQDPPNKKNKFGEKTMQCLHSSHHCNREPPRKGPAEACSRRASVKKIPQLPLGCARGEEVQLLLPPDVDEPASSHTATLRNASSKASAGCFGRSFHNS